MKKREIAFVFIYIFFALSCTKHYVNSLTFSRESEEEIYVYVYESGNIAQVSNFSGKSEKMKAIEKFLNKEERGWEKSIVNYAPFIKICGSSWTITLQQERAIINYKDTSEKLRQIVTKISPDEFEEIQFLLIQDDQ